MKPLLAIIFVSIVIATYLVGCKNPKPLIDAPVKVHEHKVVIKNSSNVEIDVHEYTIAPDAINRWFNDTMYVVTFAGDTLFVKTKR
jgi:hypothetical protein